MAGQKTFEVSWKAQLENDPKLFQHYFTSIFYLRRLCFNGFSSTVGEHGFGRSDLLVTGAGMLELFCLSGHAS